MAVETPTPHGGHNRNAVYGIVTNTPASEASDLFVRIPSTGNPEPFGPLPWTPRRVGLPSAGDECLVIFDERGNPWVVAFAI